MNLRFQISNFKIRRFGVAALALLVAFAPLLLAAAATLLTPATCVADSKPLDTLNGQLLTTKGDVPVLKINGREQPLSADTPYLLHTLQDKRLAGREVHLEGIPKPDGTFEVHWLYTVHDGKLFSVRYYCPRCNIVALEPGNCVCCQQPTELQEIPKPENSH